MVKLLGGIEDAGRGPVIGPMVIAGVVVDESDVEKLRDIGVKDSKLLTPKKREELFEKIKKLAKDYKIIIIEPKEIDEAVESIESNLNKLEGEKMTEAINSLKADEFIVDCPSVNIKSFAEFLKNKIKIKTNLICEHKAERHPQVGAASILAKVTRDREIKKLKEKYGEIGSGYPADPITQKFIKENWNKHPEMFRKSWATFKNITNKKEQKGLSEY